MKIISARAWTQFQPFAAGTYRCRGRSEDGFTSTIVAIAAEGGVVGWGEMAPLGAWYSQAFPGGAGAGMEVLLPELIARDARMTAVTRGHLDQVMTGQPYVKSPVDMALWDLKAKLAGVPLYCLLGGRFGERVALYRSVSEADAETMAAEAAGFIAAGYRRLQVKVGQDPRQDAQCLRAVVEILPPGTELVCDANGAFTTHDALKFLSLTRDIDYALEQPCATLEECVAVRRAAGDRPIILDESVTSLLALQRIVQYRCADGVTLKLSRLGGVSDTVLARDLAVANGLKVCIEDTGGSVIDTAATVHLMISTPEHCRLHTVDFMNWVTVSNARGMPQSCDGHLSPSEANGLGIEVDESSLGPPLVSAGG